MQSARESKLAKRRVRGTHLLILADPLDIGDGAVNLRLRACTQEVSCQQTVRAGVPLLLVCALWLGARGARLGDGDVGGGLARGRVGRGRGLSRAERKGRKRRELPHDQPYAWRSSTILGEADSTHAF